MRGSIIKRGNKYSIVVDVGRDEKGKRKQKWFSGYHSRKAAEKDLPQILSKIQTGNFVEPTKMKMKEFLQEWLKIKKSDVAYNTFETYKRHIENHIVPAIGNIPLSKIRVMHAQKMYGDLEKKNLSKTSIHKTYSVLKNALRYAYKTDLIAVDIAGKIDNPKKDTKEMKFWTKEEVRLFLEEAKGDQYYVFFHLAVSTGMRPGEILGLKWDDIDPKEQTIQVIRSLSRNMELVPPKTNAGKRLISIDEKTIEELKKHRTNQKRDKLKAGKAYKDEGFVIATQIGTPVSHRNILRNWYRITKPLFETKKLSEIRLYDLRHTHASILLSEDIHPKIVSERLGHSSVRMTLDTYAHIMPGLQQEAADKFGDTLFG